MNDDPNKAGDWTATWPVIETGLLQSSPSDFLADIIYFDPPLAVTKLDIAPVAFPDGRFYEGSTD